MQAQFKVRDWDNGKTQRLFKTTTLYRAYIETGKRKSGIEPTSGIDPGESVTITVPFYTQLKEVDGDDLGKVSDQFIDWWNAGRVYIFSSAAAYHSAKSFNVKDKDGNWVEPPKVTALNGAATLTCSSSNNLPCNIYTFEPKVNPPFNIPFELQEYTFGAAEGPPNQPPDKLSINIGTVNYNISSLDSVFLPVAVGALNNKDVPYIGTTMALDAFRDTIKKFEFAQSAQLWPHYIPIYYYKEKFDGHPSGSANACSFYSLGGGSYDYADAIPGARFTLEESKSLTQKFVARVRWA
jgi:hypothetical protein